MGNYMDMDHIDDGVELVIDSENDHDDEEHLVNVLQRMVNGLITQRGSSARYFKMKMPVVRKKPDLRVFRDTVLYREIKYLCGQIADNRLPSESWSLEHMLADRDKGIGNAGRPGSFTTNECRRIANNYIPNHKDQRLMSLESKVFCGKFDKKGSKLITASQDHVIRIFDSSKGTYHRVNRIIARDVSWCILDIDFSPDGKNFVYSTWSDFLHVSEVNGRSEDLKWLNLNLDNHRSCVFSVRFSPCGRFIMAGANDGCVYIYNRERDVRTRKIKTNYAEYTDINAVCYLDDSSNIFVSGCDNGIMKLWDSRCLSESPVGTFLGHCDGITYIDARNDGRYLLTNSKDQSLKIWDIRRTSPKVTTRQRVMLNWDYRWDNVPREFYNPAKEMDGDASVMTYRGHRVTKSLIRAKFSPAEQTGQRYIYTGCGTGRVIIYDVLTGHIKEAIEGHKDIVRDVAWHPVRSEIVSSSWDTHVNLNVYKRSDAQKRRYSGTNSRAGEDEQPLRRSRRIALRKSNDQDEDEGGG